MSTARIDRRLLWPAFCGLFVLAALLVVSHGRGVAAAPMQPSGGSYDVNDVHFHLTNYVQEGVDIHDFLKTMGTRVGRVALFGIPLQQQWSHSNTGDFAPTYYLQSDAPLYYY